MHRGIGSELKRTQRRLAAELGYRTIAWTFDPLIARNAHFNLRKLGASVAEFQRNVYGQDPGDRVNRGIETDRFIAVWPAAVEPEAVPQVTSDRVPETLVLAVAEDEAPQLQPLVTALANPETLDSDVTGDLPDVVGTAIPLRFEQMLQTRTAQAWAWRYAFRTAAERLWAGGYRPTQIIRRHRDAVYCWEKGVV
ncbi:hypothetical protein GCM10025857_16480 [Alicyclobacillus contaminans]|nr:hypothetical protein GCM10025857_16480 [Alicyclobacillus contaminans]